MMERVKKVLVLALVVVVGVLAAACGSQSSAGTSSTSGSTGGGGAGSGRVPSLADAVPADLRSSGRWTIAMDASYPPLEFIDKEGKSIVGVEADLAKELGTMLGLAPELKQASFDSIVSGIASGKYDAGMSTIYVLPDRLKTVDMVSNLASPTAFFAAAESSVAVETMADICGLRVAVQKGTLYGAAAAAQGRKCVAGGKKDVTVEQYTDQNTANLALRSGRADLGITDAAVAQYLVKQTGGKFKLMGKLYAPQLVGIALPKGSGLAEPLRKAIDMLMADGRYQKILAKWGTTALAIKKSEVNPRTTDPK